MRSNKTIISIISAVVLFVTALTGCQSTTQTNGTQQTTIPANSAQNSTMQPMTTAPQKAAANKSSIYGQVNKAKISVSNVKGARGSNVKVSISITANSHLGAGTFVVSYDKTKFDYVTAKKGIALTSGLNSFFHNKTNSTIKLAYINADGLMDSGSMLDITFKIKSTATGVIPLKLSVLEFYDFTNKVMPYTFSNGSITVTGTYVAVKSVKLNKTSIVLKKTKKFKLIATVNPQNANNKKVTWKSGNSRMAVVSTSGTITAKGKGTTYITVYTVNGKKSARCKVIIR